MRFMITFDDGSGTGCIYLEAKNFERLQKSYYKNCNVTQTDDGWIMEDKAGGVFVIETVKK